MNQKQQKLYETTKSFYRNELLKSIEEKTFTKNKFSFLQGLMKLRQLSNHPILTDEMYSGGSGKFDDVVSQVNTALAEITR